MSKNASKVSLFVRPNGLHVRSNLVPGLSYDRLIGKNYLQACLYITPCHVKKWIQKHQNITKAPHDDISNNNLSAITNLKLIFLCFWFYLYVCHVDFIHIRPFLSINFYRYKFVVEDLCNLFTFKRFSLHYMTPVTGRVTHCIQIR